VSFGQISQALLSRNKEHLSCRLYPSFFALVLHKKHVMMQQVTSARELTVATASPVTADFNEPRIAAGISPVAHNRSTKNQKTHPPQFGPRNATRIGAPDSSTGRSKDPFEHRDRRWHAKARQRPSRPTIAKPLWRG